MTHRRFYPLRFIVICSAFSAGTLAIGGDEPNRTVRPITEAESVLAIYHDNWGLRSSAETSIIFVAWPDGSIVWSDDPIKGGAPYHAGHVEPKRVAALLADFDKEGIFEDKRLNRANFGPDSEFISVLIKSGKKQVKMQSWHELFEDSRDAVGENGIPVGQDSPRLKSLRQESAEYLFFRLVWSETRAKLSKLISCDSKPTAGRPVMKAGALSWQEPAIPPKPSAE